MENKLFTTEDEEKFKKDFVIQFMASWAASNYDDYCSKGLWSQLSKPQIEDAIFLADRAWSYMVAMGYVQNGNKK